MVLISSIFYKISNAAFIMTSIGVIICILAACFILPKVNYRGLLLILVSSIWLAPTFSQGSEGLGQYPSARIMVIVFMTAIPVSAFLIRFIKTKKIIDFAKVKMTILQLKKINMFKFARQFGIKNIGIQATSILEYLEKVNSFDMIYYDKSILGQYDLLIPKVKKEFSDAVKPLIDKGVLRIVYSGEVICVLSVSECFYITCSYQLMNGNIFGMLSCRTEIKEFIKDESLFLSYLTHLSPKILERNIILLHSEFYEEYKLYFRKYGTNKKRYIDTDWEKMLQS